MAAAPAMTTPRRLAVIDLGTNTVRLLVAEAEAGPVWRAVHAEQRVTRLGEGLEPHGALGSEPMARTSRAVKAYVASARRHGAVSIRVVATSAVRDARNGGQFARDLAAATGTIVDVVSGEDEARLTLRGLRRGLRLPSGRMLAFDIGGGSTEYVLARDGVLESAVSLRLGVVALAERFTFPERVEPSRYEALVDDVRGRLAREIPAGLTASPIDVLVGTAGTVTTLAALDLGLSAYDPERVHGHRLTRGAVETQRTRLAALTVAQRGAVPCLEPGRADLIVPGIAIVMATFERWCLDGMVVSEYGLREGMMDAIVGSDA
jgi:exopolyphosphatase / guanosine-5'-triphosphate,3'-diphosphate pyrophosphatase